MKTLLIAPSINPVTYKGLGKYSKEIYEGLKERVEVDLLLKSSEGDKVVSTHTEVPLKLLKARGYDVVHALTPEMGIYTPLISKKTVATFHDLIPILAFKEMKFKFSSLIPYYTKVTWKLSSKARRIIANSTQTREELIRILGVKPEKIKVIPLGVDERFKPVSPPKKREKPTIGFFGNLTYRKRVDIAIKVFKIVSDKIDARLILAGGKIDTIYQRHFNVEEMLRGLKNVRVMGNVPDGDLPRLYTSFDVMLFPSSYEGFGLPILEAQRCGIPVLTMSDARIPEEVKREAITCGGLNGMAEKALELLLDTDMRRRISEEALRYASQFAWNDTVMETLKIYDEL